jgi:ABC-type phosphate/phosphonate transport system permease subunit
LLSIESVGGKELHDEALVNGDLAGSIFSLCILGERDMRFLWTHLKEIADRHGVKCAGGNWAQQMRFGILPQIAPNLLSYAILRFEINVRGASVIGFVGAGGIGQELYAVIAQNYYEEISAIVVLIIVAVALIDLTSERLRRTLTDGGRA